MYKGKYIFAATVAVCIFVSAMIQILIINPGESEILYMKTETLKNQKILAEIERFKKKNKDLSEIGNIAAERLDEARKFLPTSISSDTFIKKIYSAARLEKVDIVSVNLGEIEEFEDIKAVGQKIEVRTESDYVSLTNFIREISDDDRLANLNKFSIVGDKNSGKILDCRLEFEIFAAE